MDLAVDWVANNLYWTDEFWARIEVMDLDTRERAEVIRTGNHTVPRGIVVDPINRYACMICFCNIHIRKNNYLTCIAISLK